MSAPAIVALTATGAALARRLAEALPGAQVHGLARRVANPDVVFDDAPAHLRALFAAGTPIVAICASGIVIRALAPLLSDKTAEPPVVAVAESGTAVVPLLGGHRGANALARTLGKILAVAAAVTTASDVSLGAALDDPPPGWRIAAPAAVKDFAAALLAGEPVALRCEAGSTDWLSALVTVPGASRTILVTDRAVAPDAATLVYHPPVLAVGVGCERGVAEAEVRELVHAALERHGLSPLAVAGLFSIDIKQDEPALAVFAADLGVPLRFFTAERLAGEEPRLANPSEVVRRATGTPGVAEAAALAAAGPDAVLVVPKTKSARATVAVARAPAPIDAARTGTSRGRLAIVGIGPGTAEWRTPEAGRVLAAASDVVGYRLYLDLIGDLIAGKVCHSSTLGAEEDRVRAALDLAAAGRAVALVSSGDAGIYGLATLVFELLDRSGRADWARVDITVCPGLSALQAAAARAGAPLGHDFAAISLSDLLTPWPVIEARLRAAAAADFVLALYNPASQRRRHQLDDARAILLAARGPKVPIVLARNLGRAGEHFTVAQLGDAWTTQVDMLTLVLIGSRESRLVAAGGRTWLYTPRGYAAKVEAS